MTNCTIFFLILIKKDEGAVSFTENIVSVTLFTILNVYTFNFPLEKRIYMNLEISDIVILLSEDKEAEPIVKKTLSGAALNIYSEDGPLRSIENLRSKAMEEGNLAFIKNELMEEIKTRGYPFLTILDYRINTGLKDDRDMIRVLRTILISYIIIMQSKSYENISSNMLILTSPDDYSKLKYMTENPAKLLDSIKTTNDQLNSFIKSYSENREKFNKSFNIVFSSNGFPPSQKEAELNIFINRIKIKNKLRSRFAGDEDRKSPQKTKSEPASVIFRIDESVFINGMPKDEVSEDYLEFRDREIYISGNFTGYTRLDVINRLTDFVNEGAGEAYSFNRDETLCINLPNQCHMDSSIPVTLMQLIMKEFSDFKKVIIKTTMQNVQILSKFQGYSMLEKYVVITPD